MFNLTKRRAHFKETNSFLFCKGPIRWSLTGTVFPNPTASLNIAAALLLGGYSYISLIVICTPMA